LFFSPASFPQDDALVQLHIDPLEDNTGRLLELAAKYKFAIIEDDHDL